MKKLIAVVLIAVVMVSAAQGQAGARPVRLGIAGLSHDHVHGILGRAPKGEQGTEFSTSAKAQHGLSLHAASSTGCRPWPAGYIESPSSS